jgi:hypothetical protein
MRSLVIFAAIAALSGGSVAQAQTYWGAIYASTQSETYGTSSGKPSREAAQKEAAHNCNRQQHGFCREVVSYSNTCGAVAVSRGPMRQVNGVYGGMDTTARKARLSALGVCEQANKAAKRTFSGCIAIGSSCAAPH